MESTDIFDIDGLFPSLDLEEDEDLEDGEDAYAMAAVRSGVGVEVTPIG